MLRFVSFHGWTLPELQVPLTLWGRKLQAAAGWAGWQQAAGQRQLEQAPQAVVGGRYDLACLSLAASKVLHLHISIFEPDQIAIHVYEPVALAPKVIRKSITTMNKIG